MIYLWNWWIFQHVVRRARETRIFEMARLFFSAIFINKFKAFFWILTFKYRRMHLRSYFLACLTYKLWMSVSHPADVLGTATVFIYLPCTFSFLLSMKFWKLFFFRGPLVPLVFFFLCDVVRVFASSNVCHPDVNARPSLFHTRLPADSAPARQETGYDFLYNNV